jgi:hypothetical protein
VPKTDVALLDVATNQLQSILSLPSGGDTSYPGLVYRDGILWVSYYSSHEGKTGVYLAKVRACDMSGRTQDFFDQKNRGPAPTERGL